MAGPQTGDLLLRAVGAGEHVFCSMKIAQDVRV
jgi:hypothetical protein